MRICKPISISLPPDLAVKAEARRHELGLGRTEYFKRLLLRDLKPKKEARK